MTRPIIRIHDISTDEVIDREMTEEEFVEYEKRQADRDEHKKLFEQNALAKTALLNKLGITADEANLLLG